jgi:cytochrome P450
VFGAEHQRAVLSDIEAFGMPGSAAQYLRLSQKLINLNRGLHSMCGDQHAVQKRLLMGMLNGGNIEVHHDLTWAALEKFAKRWRVGSIIRLLGEMRELVLQVASHVLFGDQYENSSRLAFLLQTYFQLRREASSPANSGARESPEQLVAVGNSLDTALRMYVRECRQNPDLSRGGILARVAALEMKPQKPLSEDEVVAHSNVLFVSSTEPVAVALTWILLILSQLPALRAELRNELSSVIDNSHFPTAVHLGGLALLDRVINESLRLLPPNAFMVRITTQPIPLGGARLPPRCEVVLCPFLAHRDSESFQRPNEFLPDRWIEAPPSPFAYFPFGAGGHSCVGRSLAMYIIKTTLAFLLPRYDLVLAGDQQVNWRIHIMFMPLSDPEVTIQLSNVPSILPAGILCGPVGNLMNLSAHC